MIITMLAGPPEGGSDLAGVYKYVNQLPHDSDADGIIIA